MSGSKVIDETETGRDPSVRPAAEPVSAAPPRRVTTGRWTQVLAFAVLPCLALLLTGGIALLKWQNVAEKQTLSGATETVQIARDATIALLSYRPDTVENDLTAARDRLTGGFRETYVSLTEEVVIPGSIEKQISATATVPAAASMSITSSRAVVLLFVNQSTSVGQEAPTATASSVRVTLDKIDGRWLMSAFDPV